MRVIALKTLRDFFEKHADVTRPLMAWYHEAKTSDWKTFQDIKIRYRTAEAVPKNRVVFNIKGNTYRLVVHIHYNRGIVFIRFIGTHAEYDRIDVSTI